VPQDERKDDTVAAAASSSAALCGAAAAAAVAAGAAESGGRSLADQEQAAAASAGAAPSAILHAAAAAAAHPFSLNDASPEPSSSPDTLPSGSPPAAAAAAGASSASGGSAAAAAAHNEEKTRGLDEDDDMLASGTTGAGMFRRSFSSGPGTPSRSLSELHPTRCDTLDVSCVAQACTMQNLLTYLYTGDIQMPLLQSVPSVFDLATVGHLFHLDRLQDLCALALNRILHTDNALQALKCALHYQARVLGSLESVLQELSDAQSAALASLAGDLQSVHSHQCNAKVHPRLSPLVRVCLEFIVLHWELLWAVSSNVTALQQLPPALFSTIMRLLPLRNVPHAAFSPIYPTVHPQACNLTTHFRRLWEQRTPDSTDFAIVIGDDDAQAIRVHRAVLGQAT
jgi:hypothetical protein